MSLSHLFEPLGAYKVTTICGTRILWAKDADDARQQHQEAHDEAITRVEHDPYAEPPTAGQDPYGRPSPMTHPDFWME